VSSPRGRAGATGLRFVRLYTRYSPIARGKSRLAALGLRWFGTPPPVIVRARDGRRFEADLSSGMCDTLFFRGEYEPAVTDAVRKVVSAGDVCIDVGANFGWYTTLLARLAGPGGAVHAFEPVPDVYAWLQRNVALSGDGPHVHLVRAALGDGSQREVTLYLFEEMSLGHTSLRPGQRTPSRVVTAPLMTLDEYIAQAGAGPVSFIKADVEGAELAMVSGADRVLAQPVPPIWVIEMARETSEKFGHRPDAIVSHLRARAPYRFFAIDDLDGQLIEIEGFAPREIGANVLCVPRGRDACLSRFRMRPKRPDDFSPELYPGRFADDR
jgi:FkbM family methyltransferase